jgi:hypothetical protein
MSAAAAVATHHPLGKPAQEVQRRGRTLRLQHHHPEVKLSGPNGNSSSEPKVSGNHRSHKDGCLKIGHFTIFNEKTLLPFKKHTPPLLAKSRMFAAIGGFENLCTLVPLKT